MNAPLHLDLFPKATIPYLIVAPKYTDKSAGVRVLHMLCHSLNMIGQRAYIAIFPQLLCDTSPGSHTSPDLCTPVITQELLAQLEREGRAPIVVYPETIKNPLQAERVVRYVLNYPGLLGGDKTYPPHEIIYTYSKRIAEFMRLGEENVLFLPASDPTIFYPPPQGASRQGSCFYASKYQHFHKGTLLPVTQESFEITANQPDSLTKSQIAELFRRSEVFYTYEDTALAIEAGLCGCPTVFLPNPYLTDPLGFDDLGRDGFAWGNSPEEVAKAKATVGNFSDNYAALIAQYWNQLHRFVEETQAQVQARPQVAALFLPKSSLISTVYYLIGYIRQYGVKRFFSKVASFIRKFGIIGIAQNTLKNALGSR